MKICYRDFLKIPNIISISRIVLMAPFIYFFSYSKFYETLIVMLIIILTDFFDGFLSRKLNMVTETGKVIDPLADKICLGVGLLYIFFKANINPVIVYVLIGRDLFILILGFLLSNKMGSVPSSNIWGKLTSFFLSILGVFAFLKVFYNTNFLSWCAFYLYFISFGFIVLSSISYFLRFIKIIKRWF